MSEQVTQGAIDWKGVVGTVSTAIVGIQGCMRIFQRVRLVLRKPDVPRGVTIVNGEYRQLIDAIGRIEKRQDRHAAMAQQQTEILKKQANSIDHLGTRMSQIEDRLAATN